MYKTQFLKLSFICSIFGTQEVAETGVHICDPGAVTYNAATIQGLWTTANLTSLATNFATLMASGNLQWASYSQLVGVKLAAVGTDGKYVAAPKIYQPGIGTIGGTFANVNAQDSLVLSLRSGSTFGEANYGRMYLPHINLPLVTGTPYCSAGDASALVTHGITFIRAINTIAVGHAAGDLVVDMSQKGTGTTKAVNVIASGRLLDTQRRRRNRLDEQYSFGTV